MEEQTESNPRLGIGDKRHLFQVLLAMTERLFYLNKFPVDQADFALSMQTPAVEAAWRVLNQEPNKRSLKPIQRQNFECGQKTWKLHLYPEDNPKKHNNLWKNVFMDVGKGFAIEDARRHLNVVNIWCNRQARLEDQMLRAAKVIKAIVHSCNTVGQYKRVSPDLLMFLPENYQLALRNYTKQSPYPAITVKPQEIDTTIATLAFAALQPVHYSENQFITRPQWHRNSYALEQFARNASYDMESVRQLNL